MSETAFNQLCADLSRCKQLTHILTDDHLPPARKERLDQICRTNHNRIILEMAAPADSLKAEVLSESKPLILSKPSPSQTGGDHLAVQNLSPAAKLKKPQD